VARLLAKVRRAGLRRAPPPQHRGIRRRAERLPSIPRDALKTFDALIRWLEAPLAANDRVARLVGLNRCSASQMRERMLA
jgi:hypothetical protein